MSGTERETKGGTISKSKLTKWGKDLANNLHIGRGPTDQPEETQDPGGARPVQFDHTTKLDKACE